ncbi:MAG: hypothetical protein JO112_06950 [Planctomycetes bacterium]|nr:hypothetical protein [Planctomycetota bacterium]
MSTESKKLLTLGEVAEKLGCQSWRVARAFDLGFCLSLSGWARTEW